MCIGNLFAPEFMLSVCVADLYVARRDLLKLQALKLPTVSDWTLTHMFYANMGGFVVQYKRVDDATDTSEDKNAGPAITAVPTHTVEDHDPADYYVFHLNSVVLYQAIQEGLLDSAAPVTREVIEDQSKSHWISKALVILQLVQFFITIFARLAQSITISQLEVAVAGFALCSIISYACLLYKPKSVVSVVTLRVHETLPARFLELKLQSFESLSKHAESPESDNAETREERLSFSSSLEDIKPLAQQVGVWTFIAGGLIFGAVHLAAWNLSFPTAADAWLWRVSAIVVTVVVPIVFYAFMNNWMPYNLRLWLGFTLMFFVYPVARIILTVEMFRCLVYQPPSAYSLPSWTVCIPHFG